MQELPDEIRSDRPDARPDCHLCHGFVLGVRHEIREGIHEVERAKREGAREVLQERREATRNYLEADTPREKRRAIRQGIREVNQAKARAYRDVVQEKREARREIAREYYRAR